MSSIIPVKPFGKSLEDLQSLECVVKNIKQRVSLSVSDQLSVPLPLVFPSDFSIENTVHFFVFNNLPYNTIQDTPQGRRYVQGVWGKIFLEREQQKFKVPGSRNARKYLSLAEWEWVSKNCLGNDPVNPSFQFQIPSLPIYFAMMAGAYHLEKQGDQVQAWHALNTFEEDMKDGGLWFDSMFKVENNNPGDNPIINDNTVMNGSMNGLWPIRYDLDSWGMDPRIALSGCADPSWIDEVLFSVSGCKEIGIGSVPQDSPKYKSWGMNLTLKRKKLSLNFNLDLTTVRAVRLIQADPSDYRVI